MVPLNEDVLPVLDLARRWDRFVPDVVAAVARVVQSGRFVLGVETNALEDELARATGRRHAVTVASGTEALRLSLAGLGVGDGDEVIVPAMTAVPTAAAVCATGATPVFVDVEADTATLDPAAAAAAVTDRARAAIAVHLYGRPATIPDLGVPVLEDAAQAVGVVASTSGSAAAATSFYPTKNLGGIGDGGAVLTDDDLLADKIRRRRVHGLTHDYIHVDIEGNSRLSEVEAAALRIALPALVTDDERRRAIVTAYREAAPDLRWQAPHPDHAYHLCVLRQSDREEFRARMPFQTALHYPLALTQQPAYASFVRDGCPEAEAWAAECVTIPCFPEMTDDEVEAVCRALR